MPNPGAVNAGAPTIDPSALRGPDNYSFVSSRALLGYLASGTLVVQHTATGITPAFQQANGGGDYYANTGRETVWVHNGGATPLTVTIKAVNRCNVGPGFLHDIVTVIAAGGEASVGPAAFNIYNDGNGNVQIVYSSIVGVTVALTAA